MLAIATKKFTKKSVKENALALFTNAAKAAKEAIEERDLIVWPQFVVVYENGDRLVYFERVPVVGSFRVGLLADGGHRMLWSGHDRHLWDNEDRGRWYCLRYNTATGEAVIWNSSSQS